MTRTKGKALYSPDELVSAAMSILSRRRETFSGGRAPTCDCGKCEKCLKREAMREYRAGKAAK